MQMRDNATFSSSSHSRLMEPACVNQWWDAALSWSHYSTPPYVVHH